MGRNMFPDTGFKNLDFSVAKNWHFGDHLRAQFRAEFFNIFNHPNFANPYGGQNGFGFNDPSARPFGCALRYAGRCRRQPGHRFGWQPGRAIGFETHF